MESGGQPQSSKKILHQNLKWQKGKNWHPFQLHISHKAAKSMANLTSQSCSDLQPAVCLPSGDGAIQRSSEHL